MDLGAAMGALLLGRQLGGALALAAAETVYVGRLRAGATTEAATGWSIFVVAAAGAAVAAIALLTLRRGADRIPAPTTYVLAGDVTNDLLADGRDAAAPAT
jgi:hypothetical protein